MLLLYAMTTSLIAAVVMKTTFYVNSLSKTLPVQRCASEGWSSLRAGWIAWRRPCIQAGR